MRIIFLFKFVAKIIPIIPIRFQIKNKGFVSKRKRNIKVDMSMKKKIFMLLALVMAVMTASAADVPTYSLTKATGADTNGTVRFKVDNNDNASTAAKGKTVTITVTPNEGFVVDTVKGVWNSVIAASRRAPGNFEGQNVEVLDSIAIELKSFDETTGVKTYEFTMQRAEAIISVKYKKIIQASWVSIATPTYTGSALTPTVTVKDGSTTLTADTDYTVEYANNINAALATDENAPTVTITATGENYTGEVTKTFTINRIAGSISFAESSFSKDYYSSNFTQKATVVGDGTVTYSSSASNIASVNAQTGEVSIVNTGTAVITATVTEKAGGNYSYANNQASYTVEVSPATMTVTARNYSGNYDGEPHTIGLVAPTGATVTYGTERGSYTLDEAPTFTEVGTYTVYYRVTKRHYSTITSSRTVTIKPAPLTAVTLDRTQLVYSGLEQTVTVVSVKAGELTVPDDSYTVSGNKQTEPGTYTVTVTGSGSFTGEATAEFTIEQSSVYSETLDALAALKAQKEEADGEAEDIEDELTDAAKQSLAANSKTIDDMIAALEQQLEEDLDAGRSEAAKEEYEQQLAAIAAAIEAYAQRIGHFPVLGDTNSDDLVDVDDYVAMGQMILGQRTIPTGDAFLQIDLTSDGSLGVGDLSGELNLWMGRQWNEGSAAARAAVNALRETPKESRAAGAAAANTLTIADITICQGETKEVTIVMNTSLTAYGAQMDMTLPEGLEVVAGSLKAAADRTGMQATLARVNDSWRFGFARQGREIGSGGDLGTFQLTADETLPTGEYTISLSRIKVNVGGDTSEMLDGTVRVTVTEAPSLDEVRFSAVETEMTVNPGETYSVQVTLENSAPTMNRIASFSGNIELPEGMSLIGSLTPSSRIPAETELELNKANNKFMLWPADGAYVQGTDGVVFTFSVTATKDMAESSVIKLTNIEVSDPNANSAKLPDVTITVTMVVPDVAVTEPEAQELTYTGEAQELVSGGYADGGTMLYSLDGENYDEEVPTATEAGDYTVYYKAEGDENHNDGPEGSVDVTIAKAALTVTADDATVVFANELPDFTVSYEGFVNDETADVLKGEPAFSCDYTTESAVGSTHAIKPSGLSSDNYDITFVDGTLTVVTDPASVDVVELIDAIGEVEYTDESKTKIDDAREAYDALTDAQKTLVDNYGKLTDAEDKYAELKAAAEKAAQEAAEKAAADKAAADAAMAKIDAIGEVEYTDESKAKIDDAREAYDGLTDDQKALVDNYQTLTDAEDKYAELKAAAEKAAQEAAEKAAADKAAADAVMAKIDAIGKVEYTPECKALIDAAREAYDALTDDQKALVDNYQTLTDAEAKYAELEAIASGVSLVKTAGQKDVWYDIKGRKLDKKPTKRGVYVLNGKKIVIK